MLFLFLFYYVIMMRIHRMTTTTLLALVVHTEHQLTQSHTLTSPHPHPPISWPHLYRYLTLFQFVDVSKDFYFSFTYDLTSTFQHNFVSSLGGGQDQDQDQQDQQDQDQEEGETEEGLKDDDGKEMGPGSTQSRGERFSTSSAQFRTPQRLSPTNDTFEWNHYQTEELRAVLATSPQPRYWVLPIIQGSFRQRKFTFFGKELDIVLIARRSRHFAGTRYLKRGLSVHGKVANDCETEQIVQVSLKFEF